MMAQFSILPLGKGTSIRKEVAQAVGEVESSGLSYRLTAMGTIVEGDWDAVFALLKKIRDRVLAGSDRLYMTVSIDERKDKSVTIESKVQAVESVLGKRSRT